MSGKPARNRRPTKRQHKNNYGLTFQKLEPRQLLSVSTGSEDSNTGVSANLTPAQVVQENVVREYLLTSKDSSYLQLGDSDLRLIEIKHGLASTTTRFQQTIDGIPVYGAIVTVNQGSTGEFQQVFDLGFSELQTQKIVGPALSIELAESFALQTAGATETFAPTQGELVWYPDEHGKTATRAWQVTVFASDPQGDFLTVVSNVTGRVELQENRTAFATGSGFAHEPNPYQEDGGSGTFADNNDATSPFLDGLRVSVSLQGLDDGTNLIKGEFVDLATLNSTSLPDIDASEVTRIYEYDRDDPRFEQVVVYNTIDSIQRYIHLLGFDDDTGPTANGIRDFPTLANAHWNTLDSSFYSPGNDTLHFGDGGVDDGEDGDIIAHEYGHALQYNQNSSWGGGEMEAMGEGFGDYLAASFFANAGDPGYQTLHAAAVGEWDATTYSGDNPPNLRRVDGTKIYPDDLTGGKHADGEIWSAALWDLHGVLGATLTDQMVLESHFGLPGFATMPTAALQIIQADLNINGGVNESAIRAVFENRGILVPASGTVDLDKIFYKENDTVTIRVTDGNPVEPLSVTIESTSGDIETVTLSAISASEYENTINTTTGANAADGILQVALGDTITVTYNDPDDGTGPAAFQDTAIVSNIVEYHSTDTPISITSLTTINSVITIPDAGTVNDLDLSLNITHTFDSDLDVFLTSPNGTSVELFQDVGGSGDDFSGTMLDDEAATSIAAGSAPFSGTFRPVGNFSDFDLESVTGDWTLSISDDEAGDEGTLNTWALFIDVASVPVDILIDGPAVAIAEGDTGLVSATFEITLSTAANTTVTVDYFTNNAFAAVPATPGVDYLETAGTATFLPGETSLFVDVPVMGDKYLEAIEGFRFELANESANSVLVESTFDVLIDNDDLFANDIIVDFGTNLSPVLDSGVGFRLEDYSSEIGMGWSSYVDLTSAEKNVGHDLARDVAQMQSGTFSVDVPNGTYDVQIYFGVVRQMKDPILITFESDPQIEEMLTFGTNVSRTYTTTVSDRQLTMAFAGSDQPLQISGFKINPVAAKRAGGEGSGNKGGDLILRWPPPQTKMASIDPDANSNGDFGARTIQRSELAGSMVDLTETKRDYFFEGYASEIKSNSEVELLDSAIDERPV